MLRTGYWSFRERTARWRERLLKEQRPQWAEVMRKWKCRVAAGEVDPRKLKPVRKPNQ